MRLLTICRKAEARSIPLPLRSMLTSRAVWAAWIGAVGNFFAVNLLFLYSDVYLSRVLGFSVCLLIGSCYFVISVQLACRQWAKLSSALGTFPSILVWLRVKSIIISKFFMLFKRITLKPPYSVKSFYIRGNTVANFCRAFCCHCHSTTLIIQ